MDARTWRLSRRDRVLSLLVPVLLCAVATLQIARVERLDQSSWSGAGFGMFATIDNESNRLVRGVIDRDGEQVVVALPGELRRQAFELAVVPTEERALELAQDWGAALDDGSASMDHDQVVVEVWEVAFDGEALSVGLERKIQVRAGEIAAGGTT